MADHSAIDTALTVEEVVDLPAIADVGLGTLYFRTSDLRYFRPCIDSGGNTVLVPLIRNNGWTYESEAFRQLLGSYDDLKLATSPSLVTTTTLRTAAYDHLAWTYTALATANDVSGNSSNVERVEFPSIAPANWIGIVVKSFRTVTASGVKTLTELGNTFIPWGGGSSNAAGSFTGVHGLAATRNTTARRVTVRTNEITGGWNIQMFGGGTALESGTFMEVHAVRKA